jgi:uncharacterized membrane protein (UPF0182 family)
MRAPTDLPRRRRSTSGRIALVLAAGAILLLMVSLRGIAGFYTDFLWFDELEITSVWKGVLGAKIVLGVVFTAVFFAIMWANLAIADLIAPAFRPMGPEEQFVERYHEVVGNRTGLVRVAVAGVFALIAGPGVAGQWNSWLLFRNHVPFEANDPQFGRDIGFYVFQLPFLAFVVDWLFATTVIVLVVTAVAHYLNGGIRFQTPLQKVTPQVKAHLSVLLAVLALLKAVQYFLQRYELVYSTRGVVQGAGYTDVNAQLPALNLLVVISLFAVVLFLVNILRRGWVLPVIAVGLWALVSVSVGAAYPAFVQKFRVQPTESTKERPYIQRNITATRAAYKLRDTTLHDFAAANDRNMANLSANEETIRNVRLWDPAALRETYKRLQEIRNFYQINDVDVDRYMIDGRPTQVLISARELNVAGIPSPSWVNQHLVYTHGYGAVVTPSSAVAPDGNPNFRLKDLPPQGVPPVDEQPAIYYGQGVDGYAIVRTEQQEVDYTEANGTNHTTVYQGDGGVQMDSIFRRAALALRFGDLNPFISSFVTSDSRAIYVRNIDERVRKAAPFLRFDGDPYPVILGGRIVWIYDAYTTSSRYPYAQRADTSRLSATSELAGDNFNYIRNSIKVVIDAYTGDMTYYVVDPSDPIARAYRKAFPQLFTDGTEVEPQLREHFRYPEDLFKVQTNMFGLYHITNPGDFYNRTDAWDIAQKPGVVASAAPVGPAPGPALQPVRAKEERMEPYYLLMNLPNSDEPDFLILQPFVPFSRDDSRKDMTAFMVAKSDPSEYGALEAFVMPRERPIDGPALVNARINQDPVISQQITLLSTAGSDVRLGNLLVIPVEQSLLYVQPLYVQAEGTPLPQLKRVIAVFGDQVVMEESLEEALTRIFGGSPPTLEEQGRNQGGQATPAPVTATPGGQPPVTGGVNPTVSDLLRQAEAKFETANQALSRGDLAGYQRDINDAQGLIRRATEAAGATFAATPPATTTSTTARATA